MSTEQTFGYIQDLNVKSSAASCLSLRRSGSCASRLPEGPRLLRAWISMEYLGCRFNFQLWHLYYLYVASRLFAVKAVKQIILEIEQRSTTAATNGHRKRLGLISF